MIKALVFDFDGLILDTETPEFKSWERIYEEHNTKLNLQDWLKCIGSSYDAFDPFEKLEEQINRKVDREKWREIHKNYVYEETDKLEPLPGVLDILSAARDNNILLAIASSSPFYWVSRHLNRLNLLALFDTVCTSNDVEQVKPNPALYKLSVEKLGVAPFEAVAFEDSMHGVTAAKEAGLHCIAIPNQLTRHLDTSHADLVLDSLEQINLDKIQQLFP